MIIDLTDLQPVLGQYDTGQLLIGPLLNLSINSSFRFFYVAGKANKIYQSLGLGFIEFESDAQRQRAEIVAQIKNRFGELKILDTQLELAREAHTLWPNEETARFLATASLEAKQQSTTVATPSDGFETGVEVEEDLPSDSGKQFEDGSLRESLIEAIDFAFRQAVPSAPGPAASLESPSTPKPAKLPDAYATWPLSGEPAQPQQRRAALERDDIALAVLGLKSSSPTIENAEMPVETPTPFDSATWLDTASATETVAPSPVEETGRSVPISYRVFALASAAAFIAGIVVFASTRQTAKDHLSGAVAAQVEPTARADDLAQTTATVTAIPAAQTANVQPAVEVPSPATGPAPLSKESSQAPSAAPVAGTEPSWTQPATPADQGASVAERTPETSTSQAARAQSPAPPDPSRSSSFTPAPNPGLPGPEMKRTGPTPTAAPPSTPEAASAKAAEPAPSGPVAQSRVASVDAGAPRAGAKAAVNPVSADEIASLLGRSRDFVNSGDFAAARILLRRAAESGSAEAALMLGKTFDPLYLQEVGAVGIQADLAQCQQWYKKAAQLGSEVAARRLADLAQTGQ